jgi:hypothetical protein
MSFKAKEYSFPSTMIIMISSLNWIFSISWHLGILPLPLKLVPFGFDKIKILKDNLFYLTLIGAIHIIANAFSARHVRRQPVAAFVLPVPFVALRPLKPHLVLFAQIKKPGPEIAVHGGLLFQ